MKDDVHQNKPIEPVDVKLEVQESVLRNLCLRLSLAYVLLMIFAGSADLYAQYVGTTHVIPIVADGEVGDGKSYRSVFLISRTDDQPTNSCTLEMKGGFPSNRVLRRAFDLTGLAGDETFTFAIGDLATGFATLTCSAPVAVNTAYFLTRDSAIISVATAPSQGTFRRASLNALQSPPFTRLGLAIANNSSVAANCTIEADVDGGVVKTDLTVEPQSRISKFLDEMLSLPSDFFIIRITCDQPVAATGLLYINDLLTAVPLSIIE